MLSLKCDGLKYISLCTMTPTSLNLDLVGVGFDFPSTSHRSKGETNTTDALKDYLLLVKSIQSFA